MKTKILTGALLVPALLAFGIRALPQQTSPSPAQQGQAAPGQQNQGMTCPCPGMMGQGTMGQGMMGQGQGMLNGGMPMMGQMATHHQQMTTLMSKLMASMKAIQNEKDPAALKSKLAEHQALLGQMRGHMMQQGKMMQMMPGGGSPNCPGATVAPQPTPGG